MWHDKNSTFFGGPLCPLLSCLFLLCCFFEPTMNNSSNMMAFKLLLPSQHQTVEDLLGGSVVATSIATSGLF
jgi:hypothetical protein